MNDALRWKRSWPTLAPEFMRADYEDTNRRAGKDWTCEMHNTPVRNEKYRMVCRKCNQPGTVRCCWDECATVVNREDYIVHLYKEHLTGTTRTYICQWVDERSRIRCSKNNTSIGNLESHLATHSTVPTLFCLHQDCPERFFLRPQDHRSHIAHLESQRRTGRRTEDIREEHALLTHYPRNRDSRPVSPVLVSGLINLGNTSLEALVAQIQKELESRGNPFMGLPEFLPVGEDDEDEVLAFHDKLANLSSNTRAIVRRGTVDNDNEDESRLVLSSDTLIRLLQVAQFHIRRLSNK